MAAPAVRHETDDACLGQAAGRRFDLDQLSLRRRVRREVADIEHRPEQIVRRPEAIPTTTQVCESLRLRKVDPPCRGCNQLIGYSYHRELFWPVPVGSRRGVASLPHRPLQFVWRDGRPKVATPK